MFYIYSRLYRRSEVTNRYELEEQNIKRMTDDEFRMAFSQDTVKFFKGFGKCYCEYVSGRGWHWVSNCNEYRRDEWAYDSLQAMIRREGLEMVDLEPLPGQQKSFNGKAKIIMTKGRGKELGLKSYDELVATFEAGKGIDVLGWFSGTTARHINAYVFRPHFRYNYEYPLKKSDIKDGKMCYFKV